MANLTNPALSMACSAGCLEALTEGRLQPSAAGVVPSGVATDYLNPNTVAYAIATELDSLLGAGFDTALASNATPGVTVAASGGAAGSASLSLYSKVHAMGRCSKSIMSGRSLVDVTPADYATIAAGIKALYVEWVAVTFTPNAS
jgi:hypothetical protein